MGDFQNDEKVEQQTFVGQIDGLVIAAQLILVAYAGVTIQGIQ